MSKEIITVAGQKITRIEYKGKPVLTFKMIDELHQRPEGTAKRSFNEKKDRFKKEKHFYHIDYTKRYEFRTFGIEIPPRGLSLITERGYLLLVKSLTDELAWDIQEQLVENYFTKQNVIPTHLKRYALNIDRIPPGYFSVLSETAIKMIGPMEINGYILPEKFVPDISVGQTFNKWLRDTKNYDTDSLPTYKHEYLDGRLIPGVKLYPEHLWPDFMKFLREVWFVKYFKPYFKKRDPAAIDYLPKTLCLQ